MELFSLRLLDEALLSLRLRQDQSPGSLERTRKERSVPISTRDSGIRWGVGAVGAGEDVCSTVSLAWDLAGSLSKLRPGLQIVVGF